MKIRHLQIRNFRGIRRLSLRAAGQNVIVVGENGSGKSSIIDAIEYYFRGKVEKLSGRADVKESESIPHLRGGSTEVEILFTGTDEPFAVPYPRSGVKVPSSLKWTFKLAKNHPFVLRRSQILDFISARPGERYDHISSIVGLGDLDRIDRAWRRQRNDARKEVQHLQESVEQIYDELSETLVSAIRSEYELVEVLNDWLLSAVLEPIKERKEIAGRINELRKLVQSLPERAVVRDLRQLQEEILACQQQLERFLAQQEKVAGDVQEFWRRSEAVEDATWERLLADGNRLLQASSELTNCPLCEAPITDRKAFLARLEERVENLKAVSQLRRQIRQASIVLAGTLSELKTRLADIQATLQQNQVVANEPALDRAVAQFGEWQEALGADRLFAQIGSSWREQSNVTELVRVLDDLRDEVKRRLSTLAWDDRTENLYDLLQKLPVVDEQWQRLQLENDRLAHANYVHQQLSLVYDELIAARIRGVDRISDALEEDFDHFYRQLHPDEGYEDISIAPHRDRRSSVKLRARFYGQDPAHPLGHWSEGHLDSLGLCIFLAFVRRFNSRFKIIALDDVLTTVDAGHRLRVARLLAREFADYQTIITTHDQLWAKQLQRILSNTQLVALKRWSIEQGADFWENLSSDWKYYERQAHAGRAQDAIAGAGRNLEKFLYQMRGNLRLAVPAKPNDDYTIGDLYPPFISWVKNHPIERPDRGTFQRELNLLIDELEDVWQLRNWAGAHFNEWAETVTVDEAITFVGAVRQLVNCFECPVCGQLVAYNRSARALVCPVCEPEPLPRINWQYDKDWHERVEHMLKVDHPGVRNIASAMFEYFLQDMRRRAHLSVPATEDDSYSTADLYPPFFRWAKSHPRRAINDWQKVLRDRHTTLRSYRDNGQWQVSDDAVSDFVAAVRQFIALFDCDNCSQLLSYDAGNGRYHCTECSQQDASEPVSAYWFVGTQN